MKKKYQCVVIYGVKSNYPLLLYPNPSGTSHGSFSSSIFGLVDVCAGMWEFENGRVGLEFDGPMKISRFLFYFLFFNFNDL
jgi:hypothetical protein